MVVFEAIALLLVGLSVGILATMADVLIVGSASFLSHFALWVLVNAIVAVHVESRLKACWWAIPFNLGYIEAYFITTAASFEGYAKSMAITMAAVAIISPLLSYALWTARREKNLYGQVLAGIIVAATLAASFAINGRLGFFDVVICLLIALVLLVIPVRVLRISRAQPPSDAPELPEGEEQEDGYDRSSIALAVAQAREEKDRQIVRPTRRKDLADERRERRSPSVERRERREQARERRESRVRERREARRRDEMLRREIEQEERRQRVAERRRARERARLEREFLERHRLSQQDKTEHESFRLRYDDYRDRDEYSDYALPEAREYALPMPQEEDRDLEFPQFPEFPAFPELGDEPEQPRTSRRSAGGRRDGYPSTRNRRGRSNR